MAFGAKIKLTVDNSKGAEFRKSIQAFTDSATGSNPIKLKNIEFHITKAKVNELAKTLKTELSQSKIELNIKHINANEAITGLRKQLETMLSGLSIQGLGTFLKSGGTSEGAAASVINIKASEQTAKRNKELLTQARKDLESYRKLSNSMTKVSGGVNSQQYKDSLQWIAGFEQDFVNIEGKISKINSEQLLGIQRVIANLKEELALEKSKLETQKQQTSEKINQKKQDAKADKEKSDFDNAYKKALSLQNQIKKQMINNSLTAHDQTAWFNKGKGLYNDLLSQLGEVMNNAAMGRNSPRTAAELTKVINKVRSDLDGFNAVLTETGKTGKNVWDSLKTGWAKFGSWSIVTRTMMTAWNVLKKIKSAVVEVDAAMTELKKVTDLSEASYARFKKTASEIAIDRGSSLTNIINATADFSRLGFDIGDATEMAEAAIIYKNVGDGIDNISDASQSLISTIKAFGQETYSAMEIVDKFNKVGNEFAISSVGIGEALQKSAAALAAGGNTLEESIGLATGMNAVIQNPEIVGTALKTYSMYLRAAKTEAEDAGESTEGMANSVSELRSQLLTLTNNKVDIMLDDKSFKSTYRITKELAAVWKDISDIDQAAILERIGGKRNGNAISSLLSNFGDVEAAMTSATNAAGSAAAENEKYLNSINGKLDVLSAKFETMSGKLLNSGIVKFVIELAGAVTDVVGAFASIPLVGSPLLILIPTMVTAFIKRLKEMKPLINDIIGHTGILIGETTDTNVVAQRIVITEKLTTSLAKYDAVQRQAIANDIMGRVITKELTKDQAEQILGLLGLTASTKAKTAADAAGATTAGVLTIANKKLSLSFKELMASIPIYGWIALGITALLSALAAIPWDEWFKSVDDRLKELKETAEQAKEEIKGIKSEIDNLSSSTKEISKDFAELAQSVENLGQYNQSKGDLNTSEYEKFLDLSNQLAELYPSLTKGFDENGNAILNLSGNVDTITASLTNLLKVQQQIAAGEIMEKMPDVWAGYLAESEESQRLINYYTEYTRTALKQIEELKEGKTLLTIGIRDKKNGTYSADVMNNAIKNLGFGNIVKSMNDDPFIAYATSPTVSSVSYAGQADSIDSEWDLSKLTDNQIEQLKNELGRLSSEYQKEINRAKNDISLANSEMASYINTWLSSDDGRWNFSQLSSSMQNVVKDVLLNSDWKKAIPDDIDIKGEEGWKNVTNWLNENLLYAAQQIDDKGIEDSLSEALENALSLDALSTLIENLKTQQGFDENNPLIVYLQTKLDKKSTLVGDVQKKLNEEDWDKIEDLSPEDLEIAANLSIPDGTFLTFEQLKQEIEAQKREAALAALANKDYAESIKEIKEATDEVLKNKKLFDEAVEKVKGGENLDYDTVSSLVELDPSLADDFAKTAEGYKIAVDVLIAANEKYAQSKGVNKLRTKIRETNAEIANMQAKINSLSEEKARLEAEILANEDNDQYNRNDVYKQIREINKQINDFTNSVTNGKNAIAAYNLILGELGDNIADKFLRSYVSVVSGVESVASKLKPLADVYKDVQNGGDFDWSSILNNDTFKSTFADCTETYSAFIETITQSPSDINACQEAFNNLVGEYITASGALNDLTEDTKDAAIAMLEQGGIVNAAEIVAAKLKQLAVAKENEANMSVLLKKETIDEKIVFLEEIQMSDDTAQALFDLALEKIRLNNTKLNTSKDIEQLVALAKQAGVSAAVISKFKSALDMTEGEKFDEEKFNWGKKLVESGGSIYSSAYAEAASYYARWKDIVALWNGDYELNIPDYTPPLDYDGSKVNNGSGNSSEDTKKTFDWIERAIEKVQKAFSKLGAIAQNTYKTLTTRNNALSEQIKTIGNEIELQQTAYAAYMAKANSVGLSSDLREKVQKGAVNISEYDSKTAEIIDEYKEWYDKAQNCKDAVDDLHNSLAGLYKERFENISKDFENQLSQIEHMSNMYNISIDTAEAKGYLESVKYYTSLQDSQRNSLSALNQQLAALKSAFTEAMNSGEIKMYSDAWYEMQDSVNGVIEEIMKGNQQMTEYAKTIREIEWGHFDYLQERISQITQETEFLIDLLDNKNLFDDKGQFTDEGMAALGLYAQNYNVYMAQAEKYAREIRNIEEQMAKDPYNADLIKRKEELIKLQQESVVAAENEKQAMVDLVKEGIEKELTALKELIDAYTKTLDEAADLRNYQKKISEQAEQIANLKKQLSAKAGDTSEEAKADVQKLQVELQKAQEELQESEYERYISEQKKLLDELYTDYEDALNGRLDDIDALIGELIGTVNENAGNIAAAIEAAANNVGYNLSDSIKTIWSSGTSDITNVVSLYGERFTDKLTAVNEALNRIEINTAAMIAAAGTNAGNNSSAGNPAAPSNPSAGTSNSAGGGSSNGSSNSNGSSGGSTKPIRIGGKINAEGAPIYDYVGDTGGERQVFGNDPIYTVLDEINGYLKVRWHKLNSGVTGWFKRADVKAYKRGGIVNYTGLAQLDGSNSRPEYVLNADETKNYLALNETLKKLAAAGIFANMSRLNPISLVKPPDVGLNPVPRAGDAKFGDININIDHVEDYNDLVNKMRSDGRFEKMVQSMTVDRVAGRSSLAKNKFRW